MYVHNLNDFSRAMFNPMAQGSIRPWSERGFFMLFSWLFGLDALPYRIWVFVTQFASLILLSSITRKLTRSSAAGFLAPLLWTANSALAVPLSWTSSYNQILCAFFLLAAFHLFVRYTETGRIRDYILQFTVFLLGFGALELNVVYPALAATYAAGCARRYLPHTLPMFAISACYTIVHRSLAPEKRDAVYTMYYDSSIFRTLGEYIVWALGPTRSDAYSAQWEHTVAWGTGAVGVAIVGFALYQLWCGEDRCRRWLPIFFLAWFFIVLGPVLPLRDHISEYYLTIPTAGLAALGGWGIASAWKSGWHWRVLSLAAAAVYLLVSIPAARATAKATFELSDSVRRLFFGVERAHRLHPGKTILLADVSNYLFWKGIVDEPFRLVGITDVYLAPGTESKIDAHPELGLVEDYLFPPDLVANAIDRQKVVVYSAAGPILRNITTEYRAVIAARMPSAPARRLDIGNPIFDEQLGTGWYHDEGKFRWMGKRGVLYLGAPRTADEKLHIRAQCDPRQLAAGPFGVEVTANGQLVGRATLRPGSSALDVSWPLPRELVGGADKIVVEIEVERTITPAGDGRELGLAVGSIEIKP
jgi:hypothetical protein